MVGLKAKRKFRIGPLFEYNMGFEDEVRKANFKGIVTGAIISALGFLVALQWNSAITKTIDIILPKEESLLYLYSYAIIITIIASIIAYGFIKLQHFHILRLGKTIKHLKDTKN